MKIYCNFMDTDTLPHGETQGLQWSFSHLYPRPLNNY